MEINSASYSSQTRKVNKNSAQVKKLKHRKTMIVMQRKAERLLIWSAVAVHSLLVLFSFA
jgi:hypothetical protein